MIYLTRRERFNAAHRLFRKEWSDEKNFEIFGKCSNPNWHGHNYQLFVTIKGTINPQTGFVINLKQLSKIVREKVIEKIDHKNLNLEVDFMQGKITTAENIAVVIWNMLRTHITSDKELEVVLYETPRNFVTFSG